MVSLQASALGLPLTYTVGMSHGSKVSNTLASRTLRTPSRDCKSSSVACKFDNAIEGRPR